MSLFWSHFRNPFLDFGVLIDLHFAAIEGNFAGIVIAGNIPDQLFPSSASIRCLEELHLGIVRHAAGPR